MFHNFIKNYFLFRYDLILLPIKTKFLSEISPKVPTLEQCPTFGSLRPTGHLNQPFEGQSFGVEGLETNYCYSLLLGLVNILCLLVDVYIEFVFDSLNSYACILVNQRIDKLLIHKLRHSAKLTSRQGTRRRLCFRPYVIDRRRRILLLLFIHKEWITMPADLFLHLYRFLFIIRK